MNFRIEITSAHDLMKQAWMTADDYLRNARRCIDEQMGEGYADQHPELIAAFMQTCAQDFHTAMMKAALETIADFMPEPRT